MRFLYSDTVFAIFVVKVFLSVDVHKKKKQFSKLLLSAIYAPKKDHIYKIKKYITYIKKLVLFHL